MYLSIQVPVDFCNSGINENSCAKYKKTNCLMSSPGQSSKMLCSTSRFKKRNKCDVNGYGNINRRGLYGDDDSYETGYSSQCPTPNGSQCFLAQGPKSSVNKPYFEDSFNVSSKNRNSNSLECSLDSQASCDSHTLQDCFNCSTVDAQLSLYSVLPHYNNLLYLDYNDSFSKQERVAYSKTKYCYSTNKKKYKCVSCSNVYQRGKKHSDFIFGHSYKFLKKYLYYVKNLSSIHVIYDRAGKFICDSFSCVDYRREAFGDPPSLVCGCDWDNLSRQVWDIFVSNQQLEETFSKKVFLKDCIFQVVRNVLPKCYLYIVGSSLNGFGSDSSDVDTCLMVTFCDINQKHGATTILRLLQRELNNCDGTDPPVLPCLQKTFPEKFHPKLPVVLIPFAEQMPLFVSNNEMSLGELFFRFLDYYAYQFRFSECTISVRTGQVVPTYQCKRVKSKKNDSWMWTHLCIEEPFDLTNTAKSVYDETVFARVKEVFTNSRNLLMENKNLFRILSCK